MKRDHDGNLENGDSHKISGELKPRFSEYHCGNSIYMTKLKVYFDCYVENWKLGNSHQRIMDFCLTYQI